jgi:predicted RNA-binding protein with PUA domain
MTEESIMVEFEAYLCVGGEKLKVCPVCELETYQRKCPVCKEGDLTGDQVVDTVFADLESGKEVDLNELRKPTPKEDEEYEPVIPGAR